ncbi:MAG TPA: LytTR family DNA-binding domain-containing protein [Hanamia sp.]|nr:LytTR family DNA-binding domain-containing protein [Hanamia sp.]
MIKAIIIDDEAHCIRLLKSLLAEYGRDRIELLGSFQTVEQGITAIYNLHPDLIFLDVQMNGQTGFDLLKQIKEINFEVIFTTAYEKYAVQAFKFSAIDYLLKPIDSDDLINALDKVFQKTSKNEISLKLEALFHNLKNINGPKKISVPTLDGLVFLEIMDIIRIQSHSNYTTIYLKDHQKLTVAKTLKEYENLLSDYNFYRVHNSHLINVAHIKKYNKGKGGIILMSDQSEIEVSSRKKEEFLKKLSGI